MAPDPREDRGPGAIRVYLGTIPDYAQSDAIGVVLSAVAPDGPAERAGLRGGDAIVAVGERAIENIYDYTYALDELSVGEPVVVTVERAGRRIDLLVTPSSRE